MKVLKTALALVVSMVPYLSYGQEQVCSDIIKNALAQRMHVEVDEEHLSRSSRSCEKAVRNKLRGKHSRKQARAISTTLCTDSATPITRSSINRVKRIIPRSVRKELRRCRSFYQSGGEVATRQGQAGTHGVFNYSLLPARAEAYGGLRLEPADVFSCVATSDGIVESPFTKQPEIGSCTVDRGQIENKPTFQFSTSVGLFGGALFTGLHSQLSQHNVGAGTLFSPININDCSAYQNDPSILECTTMQSYHDCLGALEQGIVRDCRAEMPGITSGTFPYQQEEVVSGFSETISSTAEITVRFGLPGAGSFQGGASYSLNFTTPVLPPAVQCDPNCPIAGPSPCNRNCIKADKLVEHITGEAGGLFAISLINGVSCTNGISGDVAPDTVDLDRAYQACEHDNAWGGTTEIAMTFRSGKLYQFNNPTTTQIPGGWEYTNIAELVYLYRTMNLPVTVHCKQLQGTLNLL